MYKKGVKIISNDLERVGHRIRYLRKLHKMTQKELGRRVGMSESAISQVERGIMGLSQESVLKLSRELTTNALTLLTSEKLDKEQMAYSTLATLLIRMSSNDPTFKAFAAVIDGLLQKESLDNPGLAKLIKRVRHSIL